mgnify:FL=1
MKANWLKRTLYFKRPAGTSRGVMKAREVWYVILSNKSGKGIGECAPLPGLSIDQFEHIESQLEKVCLRPNYYIKSKDALKNFPSIRFGLEMAYLDLLNGGGQSYYSRYKPININGLIWMGSSDFMIKQIEQKLQEKWKCIKIKIGSLSFEKDLEILNLIRSKYSRSDIELRVDANGAFSTEEAKYKLKALSKFDLHSIEQPIMAGQWDALSDLCRTSPIPIALDEELIPLVDSSNREKMITKVKPQYIILKPSLLGGFSECEGWIALAKKNKIGWWITSALESNIGLNAIAQWTAKLKPKGYQGLGTGQLFSNNIPSPLSVNKGQLISKAYPMIKEVQSFISAWFSLEESFTLSTSGSTGKPKSIFIKKEWMKYSVELTRKTFGLERGHSALLCLPINYIAGKMMLVRSLQIGLDLTIVKPSLNPLKNIERSFDFIAMIPAQLENSLSKISKTNTVIVGGGRVGNPLLEKIKLIPTRIYETYGMTETLTHVAIKRINGMNKTEIFSALNGITFEKDDRDCLIINAKNINPNPIITNDMVELITKTTFKWIGRFDNIINSGGIKISPEVIEKKMSKIIKNRRFFIAALKDRHLGEKVILVIEGNKINISYIDLDKFEKPKEIYFLPKFKESVSGKILRKQTLLLI